MEHCTCSVHQRRKDTSRLPPQHRAIARRPQYVSPSVTVVARSFASAERCPETDIPERSTLEFQ